MEYHQISIKDKEWMDQAFREDTKQACEYCFANNFLWNPIHQMDVAQSHGCLVMKYRQDEKMCYAFPVGKGDKKAVIHEIIKETEENKTSLIITGMDKKESEWIQELFPEQFTIRSDRDYFDYIYNTEDLIHLSGKKYHGKRNHIARFRDHDWSYERISEENIGECMEMLEIWKEKQAERWGEEREAEFIVVKEAFKWYSQLDLIGGLVRQEGSVVAFCIGEELTADTFVVHFEKAFSDVQGAYPIINQQFVEQECQKYTYINREEDAGEEGLRKAKLSYRPVILLEKFQAYQREEIS